MWHNCSQLLMNKLGFLIVQRLNGGVIHPSIKGHSMNANSTALDACLARTAAIHAKLERLQQFADDHFGHDPDAIRWGHVGTRSWVIASRMRRLIVVDVEADLVSAVDAQPSARSPHEIEGSSVGQPQIEWRKEMIPRGDGKENGVIGGLADNASLPGTAPVLARQVEKSPTEKGWAL